jgi:microcystin-dependent protein
MRKTSDLPNSGDISADYPFGSILDQTESTPGTPVVNATYSDFIQNLWRFFTQAGIVPNGNIDNVTNGFQLNLAMQILFAPVGMIQLWAGSLLNIPYGWLQAAGQSLLIADYAEIYAKIGNTYGSSSGHFNLPNLKDKFPLGQGDLSTTPGVTGGEKDHTLTSNESPVHYHLGGIADDNENGLWVYGGVSTNMPGAATVTMYSEQKGPAWQGKTNSVGGGASHNNMPPYIVLPYIIKVKYL